MIGNQLYNSHYLELNPNAKQRELCDLFGTKKEPDVGGCVIELIDPGMSPDGVEILRTETEEAEI